MLVLILFTVGMAPFFLFTAEPPLQAIYNEIMGGRRGGAAWTVGRTGNVNYNWGSYVGEMIKIGRVGSILAAFYALLLSRSVAVKVLCWAIWGLWMLLAIGTGTRGLIVFQGLPVVFMLFLKYQVRAAMLMKKFSWRAYGIVGLLGVLLLAVVQFQAYFRDSSYEDVGVDSISSVSFLKVKGNAMFSSGLLGFGLIPEQEPFFASRIVGEGLVRTLPTELFHFVIGPIPRALWRGKPIDGAWEWYNRVTLERVQGRIIQSGASGTTISMGLVGHFYFRYGSGGVVMGGLMFGFLCLIAEVALGKANGRMLRCLVSLAMATWLFRCFRNLNFHNLYPILIAAFVTSTIIYIERIVKGEPPERDLG